MSLKTRFCAKCGKQAKLLDGFCSECYFDTHSIKIPKRKELRICCKCGAVLIGRFWVITNKSNPEVLAEQTRLSVRTPEMIKVIHVDLGKIISDSIMDVTFELDGNVFSKQYPINLEIKKQVCPVCKHNLNKKNHPTIQLRTKSSYQRFIQEMYDYLKKYNRHIVKIKEIRTGLDVNVTSRDIGLRIARDLKKIFNMHMRETREEYSWDRTRNKPRYRSTILLKKR